MLWAQHYSPDPMRICLPSCSLARVKGSSETKILYGLLGKQEQHWRTEQKTRKEKNLSINLHYRLEKQYDYLNRYRKMLNKIQHSKKSSQHSRMNLLKLVKVTHEKLQLTSCLKD